MPADPALSIACPWCQQPEGIQCHNPQGKPTRTHTARVKSASTRPRGAPSAPAAAPAKPEVALPTASGSASIDHLLDTIICGDALTEMGKMPSGCVDLIFTSPPYNLLRSSGNQGKGGRGKWMSRFLSEGYVAHKDNMAEGDYVEWQAACLVEMARLLKPGGAIYYNHRGRVQADRWEQHGRRIIDAVEASETCDVYLRQPIIWDKGSGFNHNPGYHLPSYEVVYLLARPGESRHRLRGRDPDVWPIQEEADEWVWKVGREKKPDDPRVGRTAPFPVALVRKALGPIGDLRESRGETGVVLDPFMGSGTTAVAAVETGCWHYIGIEIDAELCEYARERIAAAKVDAPVVAPTGAAPEFDAPVVAPTGAAPEFDAPLVAPLSEREQTALDFIRESSALIGGGPPLLDQNRMAELTGIPRRSLQRTLESLRRKGQITWGETSQGRRGPRRYYLVGQHEETGLRISAVMASPKSGASKSGASNGRPAGSDKDLAQQLAHQTESPADLRSKSRPAELMRQTSENEPSSQDKPLTSWDAAAPSCPACGPQPVCQSEIMADRGVPGVTWYCAGQNKTCGFVWHYDAGGMVRRPDEPRFDDYAMMAEFLLRAIKGQTEIPTVEARETYSVTDKPQEPPPYSPPEPPVWDESHPHYRPDKPTPWDVWQAAMGRLQLEIPQEQFNTFLRPCVGLRWEDDRLVVGAATTFAVSWLELPLHLEMVREALIKTTPAATGVRYLAMPAGKQED